MKRVHRSLLLVVVAAVLSLGVIPAQAAPQSPINLPFGLPVDTLPALDFSDYPDDVAAGLDVKNEGGTVWDSLKITIPAGTASITVGTETYDLQNIHFHHHSEHKMNGVYFPMEMHLVHKSA